MSWFQLYNCLGDDHTEPFVHLFPATLYQGNHDKITSSGISYQLRYIYIPYEVAAGMLLVEAIYAMYGLYIYIILSINMFYTVLVLYAF